MYVQIPYNFIEFQFRSSGGLHMKNERLEFRANAQERECFEKAASFLGMNISTFIRMAALERATNVLKSDQTLVLSDEDRDLFLAMLENPPKPNENLIRAFVSRQSMQD